MKTAAVSLLFSSGCVAFSPATFGHSRSNTALHVSVVRDLINKKVATPFDNDALLREAFETQTPQSVGVDAPGIQGYSPVKEERRSRRKNAGGKRRKHNYRQQAHLHEEPDLDFFTLHSSAISHLHEDMPVKDIVRAIKRAQNLHDVHDLATIGAFLMDQCDEHWGFGYRGSLLSRLAVAALHCRETDLAMRAIQTRRIYERPSMLPYESAAIVRGLMRVDMVEEGWEVLQDELRLPMPGTNLQSDASREILKHRARALSSIASRHFYNGEPYVAAQALSELGSLGEFIEKSGLDSEEIDIPWARLVTAASKCGEIVNENGWDVKHFDGRFLVLQADLAELVWEAMGKFPCPGGAEECSLEDYITAEP
mmetsp:Transcript_128071/g.370678  ORF Transcript_128071/g.370678 Transcript_128071/m.370678 type:complete len:368 (+) Transcript_128071:33-1136(+)